MAPAESMQEDILKTWLELRAGLGPAVAKALRNDPNYSQSTFNSDFTKTIHPAPFH
jgi:hypothetical protein